MDKTASQSSEINKLYLYSVTLVISIGGFLFCYISSLTVGGLLYLTEYFQLTPAMKGFAVSSMKLGSIAGPIFGLWFADRFGRNRSMMIAAWCLLISAIGSALAITIWDFAFWRCLGGAGVGLIMVASPIYIAELAPTHMRSKLVNINQMSIVTGINVAVFACYFLSFGGHWRWMFATTAAPALILMIGLMIIPKSPRWLATKNRSQEALDILTKINGEEKAETELNEIKQSLNQEAGHFKDLLKPGIRLALTIGVILMIFSQINGVNMMLQYGPTILVEAGIGLPSNAILTALPNYVLIFICTIVSFWLVAKFSRRGLLISTVACMAFAQLLMGIIQYLNLPTLAALIPMLIGAGSFTLGFAPLSWIITSEIFPNRIRGKAMAVVGVFLHGSSYVCMQVFPILTHYFSIHFGNPAGVYWIFCGICTACVLFAWRMVPETKKLSLEEIGNFWLKKTNSI